MNEMKKGKSYIKDNQGILNTLKMFFLLYRPIVYWFTIIICDCIVCKKLLEAEHLFRSCLDQGRGVGVGGCSGLQTVILTIKFYKGIIVINKKIQIS